MKMTRQLKLIQGDVILRAIAQLPAGLNKMENKAPEGSTAKILQKSETTGHHHHFQGSAAVDMYTRNALALESLDFTTITPNEGKYIVVRDTDAILFHGKGFEYNPYARGTGDHNALRVPPGIYEIDIAREYDYDRMTVARVVD